MFKAIARMLGAGSAATAAPIVLTNTPPVSTVDADAAQIIRLPRPMRLAAERAELHRLHPQFTWQAIDSQVTVQGSITSHAGRSYQLRIVVEAGYPFVHPRTFILTRLPYKEFYQASHSMHTLSPDQEGNAQICLYKDSNWRPNLTLHHVLIKAAVWIEAYETHRRMRRPLCEYLSSR